MKYSIFVSLFLLLTVSFSYAGVGDPAPDFTLNTLDGGEITLSDLKGKIVYINWFGHD